METATIENRADFAQWAIERAAAIIADKGSNLALAARGEDDTMIAESANVLGQAIVDALLEVFDVLVPED
jgi:hypothetical protein